MYKLHIFLYPDDCVQFEKALRLGMEEGIQKANEGKTDYKKGTEYLFNTVSRHY